MKFWFFKESWKSSNGRKITYYAVTAQGCHMTSGSTLAEAIYMAHALVACIIEDADEEKFYDEPFDYLNDGIFDTDSRKLFIGLLNIDIELLGYRGWLRVGDKAPHTKQYPRFEMLWRAFRLTYKKFKFGSVAQNSK